MANNNLTAARMAKKDEFYTRWEDIEKEVNAYLEYNPDVFRDKTILLPADDPFESNFFKFFATHFNDYGLKKLISTSYDPSPIVNTQLSLFNNDSQAKPTKISKAYKIELTNVADFDQDGRINITDVESRLRYERQQIKKGKHSDILSYLKGDTDPNGKTKFSGGDFRSAEVTKLRDEADIIITNPPFSLFREFINWINPKEKKFLVIGNINAITYKEIFPLIKENLIWLGNRSMNKDMYFNVPGTYKEYLLNNKKEGSAYKIINNIVMGRLASACWFTNLDHGRRHQKLQLMTMDDNLKFNKKLVKKLDKYGKKTYPHYDNYDAIEVPFIDAIPNDYSGVMGVPITFLDKYNPDQFEIVSFRKGEDGKDLVFTREREREFNHTFASLFNVDTRNDQERRRKNKWKNYLRQNNNHEKEPVDVIFPLSTNLQNGLVNDTRINGKKTYVRMLIRKR